MSGPTIECLTHGCDSAAKVKGMCRRCYGRTLRGYRPRPNFGSWTAERRFFWHVTEVAGCWEWEGSLSSEGYGRFAHQGSSVYAHRWSYEFMRADIPDGLHIDHLCMNRKCVNPWHLEPVTQRVNNLRGNGMSARHAAQTHCAHGHPFSAENTYIAPGRWGRKCRQCMRDRAAKYAKAARA